MGEGRMGNDGFPGEKRRALERAVKFDERRKESEVSIDRRRGYMGKSSDAPGEL
jgi:hypothetical protein